MMRRCVVFVVAVVLAVAVPAVAQMQEEEDEPFAGITGAGARPLGMGGAFIAVADDATAASWNPAGLCVLERPEVALSGQPLVSIHYDVPSYSYSSTQWWPEYTSTGTTTYQPWSFSATKAFADFASVTYPFRVGNVKIVPQISYQRVVDLRSNYDYEQRFRSRSVVVTSWGTGSSEDPSDNIRTGSQTKSGGIGVVAASVGVSFTPKLYLGLAVNRWGNGYTRDYATVTDYSWGITNTWVGADEESYGGTNVNVGILFKPTPKVRLGAVYKSGFKMTRDGSWTGDADYSDGSQSQAYTNDWRTEISWPRSIGAGLAVMPREVLTVSLDFTLTGWSGTEAVGTYDWTSHGESTAGWGWDDSGRDEPYRYSWPVYSDPEEPLSSENPGQNDSSQLRLGMEYVVTKPGIANLVALPLRAGYIRDGQIFKNVSDLSRVTFNGFTLGVGFAWQSFALDLAYVHSGGGIDKSYDVPRHRGSGTANYDEANSYEYSDKVKYGTDRLIVSAVMRFK